MHIDGWVALAGLLVGFTVGLTGMGGGALMTPILVLFFKIQPLAAVSSDLVAAFIMKPVGGAVHLKHGTVNKPLVGWLVLGSVPSAFAGVLILKSMGNGEAVQHNIKIALGVALLVAVTTMIGRAVLNVRRHAQDKAAGIITRDSEPIVVKPLPTVLIGVLGGVIVGMTSVGSGSLIIIMLLMLYPQLNASELVGTDLVQAVPLVGAAAFGHLLFGDFSMGLTTSLLIGCLPGVYAGAKVSSVAPGNLIRRALCVVLTASGLKLLGVGNVQLLVIVGIVLVAGPLAWKAVRRSGGFQPQLVRRPRVSANQAA